MGSVTRANVLTTRLLLKVTTRSVRIQLAAGSDPFSMSADRSGKPWSDCGRDVTGMPMKSP
jgi:hypothetical protein